MPPPKKRTNFDVGPVTFGPGDEVNIAKSPAEQFLDERAPNLTPAQRETWMRDFGSPVVAGTPALGRRVPKTERTFDKPPPPEDEGAWARAGAIVPTGEQPGSMADAAKRGAWTDVDRQQNAEAKKKAADLVARGVADPERARQLAGVRPEPGEIGPPPPAEEATDDNPAPGPRTATAGGGAPVMVSPGGRTPHSWATQTQEGIKLSPDTKAAAEGAENSAFSAADLHAQADERAAAGELSILRRHELVQQARETELRDRADRQRQQYETSLAHLNEMTQAVQADRIDPEQWFKTRSNAQLFAAGLGVALGAFGQGLRGGGANPGLELVNNAIGSEIDAQKANARLRREKLEDQRSLLGQMARTYGDERVAEDAAWVLYLEKAKTQLAAQMAASKSDFAKAKYADAITQVKEQIASRREKWDQLEQDRVTRVQHDVNAPPTFAGGAGGSVLNATDEKADQELTERLVKSNIPGMRADLDRLLAVVPKSGDVPGVTSAGAGTANMLGGRAEKVYGAGYNIFGSPQGQEIRQAAAVLFNRQLKDESGAAVSDQELERQKAAFYGARDARSARAALLAYGNRLNALESTIRSGFKPNVNDTQEQRRATEAKRLERTKKFTGPKPD